MSSYPVPVSSTTTPTSPYSGRINLADAGYNPAMTYTEQYSPSDVKETQFANQYDEKSGGEGTGEYQPTVGNYRPRSPYDDGKFTSDGTLSTFLAHLASTATNLYTGVTTRASSPPSYFPPKGLSAGSGSASTETTRPFALPSSSNVGFIALCGLWYISSAISSNTGKSILTQFRYPVTLTFVQFAFVAGYCVFFLALRERVGGMGGSEGRGYGKPGWGIKKPTKVMFQGTLVMSLFQIAGHVFSSMAIARVPVSTVHTIKALSPLFTVLSYAVLFRVRYSSATYAALAPLTIGVMLACSFDLRANAFGFLCALGSTIIFVSQNIFSKKLLPKESPTGISTNNTGVGKLDKLNLLFYSSGMAFLLMIPIWLYSDSHALLTLYLDPSLHSSSPSSSPLLLTFITNGTVHFLQNLIAFSILSRTSPVTYSIASLIKRIAVIILAILWSHQHVSRVQGAGMGMTFVGLFMYNKAKGDVEKGEVKRGKVEKRSEMGLPTTAEDLESAEPSRVGTPVMLGTHLHLGMSGMSGHVHGVYPVPSDGVMEEGGEESMGFAGREDVVVGAARNRGLAGTIQHR